MRPFVRAPLIAFLVGLLSAGAAVAGVVVGGDLVSDQASQRPATVPDPPQPPEQKAIAAIPHPAADGSESDQELSPAEIPNAAAMQVTAPSGKRLPDGEFLVGAARASLEPAPGLFGGKTWMREGCTDYDGGNVNASHAIPSVNPADPVGTAGELKGWPAASPDCIYLGGFGLGPVRPATRVGHGGVWIRTIAVSNGEKTFIYGIADTVGWFARYDSMICADCGIRDVRQRVAKDVGIGLGDVIFGSTHTHAGADTYGGWGGIPKWYRNQIRDAAIASAKQSVANLQPATIDVGEIHLRNRNNERRDTYYSTADTGATWLQARSLSAEPCPNPPGCPQVIATWATYAGHPTIVSDPILHADWPGAAARRFEGHFGGVGLMFEGGLGNVSISTLGEGTQEERAEATGMAFADAVAADITNNRIRLRSNELAAATVDITHPAATNPGLVTLASVGLFDREFTAGTPGAGLPGAYHWSRRGELSTSGEDNDPQPNAEFLQGCSSAGPTVITTTGAHRIGEFVVAFTPGEIFSNLAEVIKERADASAVTMVLGQTNDALGYIMQSFEFDTEGGGAAGEYGTGHGEYEEVFAIDRCFGDHVLETVLESTKALKAGG
ncbi:MAG TPA: hypothetical protein VG602_00955 [Actinomycetota bacterium]|nr:hypothetical protein [Actinomycetota bacterium]